MLNIYAYLRLMRFDKPIGIALLLAPTVWALWLANKGMPKINLLMLFLAGSVIMRAAGCVVNDIADRNIDGYVNRTKSRPLVAKEIGLIEALILFIALLLVAFVIVLQLPIICLYQAFFALLVTVIYPFVKRFFSAPQFFLGLAFSMSIPMAYTASEQNLSSDVWLLFILNFLWIIAYDTIYAMVDKKDDLILGVRSTAVLFAEHDKLVVILLQCALHFLWLFIADLLHFKIQFYFFWLFGAFLFVQQYKLLNTNTESSLYKCFLLNGWYGFIMWLGLMCSF